jgi:hypothetical protein
LKDTSSTPRLKKPKGSVAKSMQPSTSGSPDQLVGSLPSGSAQSAGTQPQYGLPTDGGAGSQPTDGGAEGSASSSSAPPPPVPVPLEGDSRDDRKKHRDKLRAEARKSGHKAPVTYNPGGYMDIPEICNRVATAWGIPSTNVCKCATEWPAFLSTALASGQAERTQTATCHDGVLTIVPGQKPLASYRRPGGHLMKERWWYNAILEGFVIVRNKLGRTQTIALVN